MNLKTTLSALTHLIRADFLERTRRYSFLVTLGVMVWVGYMAVPAIDSGILTVNLNNLRGVYNSAWVGSMIALLSTMLLSLPGFYLVKNAISRDRHTRVGQIIATTPLSRPLYTLGKAMSNFLFLAIIIASVIVAAAGTQLLRGEVMRIDLWQLLAPFLFITLPTLALVAAVAVLFETIYFLKGGFGNLVYFVLYLIAIVVSMSSVTFNQQGVIEEPINDLFGASLIGASMLQTAHAALPAHQLDFGIGYTVVDGTVDTFLWPGVTWTVGIAAGRLLWLTVAVGITLLAAVFFHRFDPARERPLGRTDWRQRLAAWWARVWSPFQLPQLHLGSRLPSVTWSLPPLLWCPWAGMRMMFRGQRWWWYVGGLGLIVAGVAASPAESRQVVLPLTWLWPVLIWSGLGVREQAYRTEPVVFATPYPLRRQFTAVWLAGVWLTIITGSGVAITLLSAGDWTSLLGWLAGVLFIPTLAVTTGVWSGGRKLFEALYVAWWYIGPLSGLAKLDFMGAQDAALAAGMPFVYLAGTAVLLTLAYLGRARQIRT